MHRAAAGLRDRSRDGWLALLLAPMLGCGTCGGSGGAHAGDGEGTGASESGSSGAPCDDESDGSGSDTAGDEPLADELSPLRLLRRASIALLGVPPTDAQLDEILALGDDDARFAYVESFVAEALGDVRFYDTMFETGKTWLNVRLIDRSADEPEFGPKQQRVLAPCEAGTANAGKLHYWRNDYNADDGACDAGAPSITIEPWWAPGENVELVGNAAN
ncbi:MAG TPA: hypothetical protein VG755_01560, partial [Nannocystaceae bacterium]|nr:hypothetical protein [Nannocystaceae bacterium]